jgi:hypothetical protein
MNQNRVKVVVKRLPNHLPWRTEENHENTKQLPVAFDPVTFYILKHFTAVQATGVNKNSYTG